MSSSLLLPLALALLCVAWVCLVAPARSQLEPVSEPEPEPEPFGCPAAEATALSQRLLNLTTSSC